MSLRNLSAALVALLLLGPDARATLPQAEDRSPGSIVIADEAGVVEAAVGDLIHLEVGFPVVPGQMAKNLRVQVEGDAVRSVTVVKTVKTVNGRPIIGSQTLAAVLVAEKAGEATVRIIPINQEGEREPLVYTATVGVLEKP